jgi:hypothetical protein
MRTTTSSLCLAAGLCLTAWLARPVLSCCALPREPLQGHVPVSITLDQQSAFLWREGKQEHMLLSVKYSGTTDEFAWVIPVESKPKVTVEKGAPFTELRRATKILAPVRSSKGMEAASAPGGAPPEVTVLERKEEGPYDLAVLSATSGGGLYRWLKANGFHLSKNARGHLNYYVDKQYVFVAARIRSGAKDNQTIAERLRKGTIAPMHLTFKAKELTYPLKVTAANPGISSMELYVAGEVDPHRARDPKAPRSPFDPRNDTGLRQETFELTPSGKEAFTISGPPGVANSGLNYPTLRRLMPKGGKLHKFTAVMNDAQRQDDLVFAKL